VCFTVCYTVCCTVNSAMWWCVCSLCGACMLHSVLHSVLHRTGTPSVPAELALLHPIQNALGWYDLGLLCHGCRWKRRVAPVGAACMEGLERRRPWKRLYCNILNPFNRLRFGFTNLVILPGYKILVILPLIRGRADEFRRNICHARTCSYIQIYFSFRINVHMWDETTGFLFAKRDISTTRGSYCSLLE